MKSPQVINEIAKALVAVRNLDTLLEFTKTRVALRQEVTGGELDALEFSKMLATKAVGAAISAIRDVEVE